MLAPEVGYLWTPGWWGWGGDAFLWHEGWWGPEVGFYGGINYGFGYFGVGFGGGRWDGGHFFYNSAVLNVNETVVHNVYNTRIENVTVNRVSYNGGNGGIEARATAAQEAAANQRHVGPVSAQMQHIQEARNNPQLRASANGGKPPIAATARPGDFKGNVVAARDAGAPYHPPNRVGTETRGVNRPEVGGGNPVHPKDLPAMDRPAANSGNAKADQKYQRQQEKLAQQQDKERQKLQQQQDQEHQRLAQKKASAEETQQVEQRHQQQTQQLQQRHQEQQQHLQSRMPAARK